MRILLCNKFYYRRGGDCIYMLNLEQMLKAKGHEVAVFAMDYPENNDTPWSKYFPSNMSKLKAFSRPFGDSETKRNFKSLLDEFKPNVVHLNNIHTQLSPVLAEIAHDRNIKVVWTLHDYKLLCPRYDCLRNGKNCELCFTSHESSKCNCLKYTCLKGGKLGSWIGYREAVKWNIDKLAAMTDLFICPSKFMADKMIQGGISHSKLQVLCNFIDVDKCKRTDNYVKGDYYCFIGRLSHEKGVKTLIGTANELPYKLVIIGDGPLENELKGIANNNIEFVGFKQWNEIKEIVGKARFSVIPSEWYENNPLSVIEAQCLGTPVLGAKIGGIPELIESSVTGMTFESKNAKDLKAKIVKMFSQEFDYKMIAEMSIERYNANKYYDAIHNDYR